MNRTRLSIGAALAVLSVTVTATPAVAVPSPVVWQSPAEAAATDFALVAKATGWTVEQAQAHRDAADRLGRLQAAVAARMPEAYVGGVLASTPGGTSTLLLKGEANAFVRQLVAAAGIPIIVVDRQPYSLEDLATRSTQVHKQLATAGYRDIATGVDIAHARVLATVGARPGLPSAASAVSATLSADVRAATELTVIDGPVGTDLEAFGGMRTQDPELCTSGFSVVDNQTGTTGVTTAGHCLVGEIVDPGDPDVVYSFPAEEEHRGDFGDVEWHSVPDTTEPPNFFTNATSIRGVTAVKPLADITVGERICVYGRASNAADCTMTVFMTRAACTVDGVFNDRLVAMNTATTITDGDSGGPWYNLNTAYGSSKGFCNFNRIRRAMFSVADLYDEAIGVSVRVIG